MVGRVRDLGVGRDRGLWILRERGEVTKRGREIQYVRERYNPIYSDMGEVLRERWWQCERERKRDRKEGGRDGERERWRGRKGGGM